MQARCRGLRAKRIASGGVPARTGRLAAGQALRLVAPLREFRARHKKRFSRAGELLLLSIIYTTFCDTFAAEGSGMLAGGARSVGCLLLGMPALHLLLLGLVFAAARLPAFG